MTLEQYQLDAKRTLAVLPSKAEDIIHMECGIMSELGELTDCFKKWFAYGKEFDRVNAREELGDVCWYLANLANITSVTLAESSISQQEEIDLDISEAFTFTRGAFNHASMLFTGNPDKTKIEYFLWRISEIASLLNFSMTDILSRNIEKLRVRYPNKFLQEDALTRNLDAELEVLSKEEA